MFKSIQKKNLQHYADILKITQKKYWDSINIVQGKYTTRHLPRK